MIRLIGETARVGNEPQDDAAARVDAALNREIATRLHRTADALEAGRANPYSVQSYRLAAATVAAGSQSLRRIHDEQGREGLDDLPGVGPAIAAVIEDFLRARRNADRSIATKRRLPHAPIHLLLELDREYREKARAGRLPMRGSRHHGASGATPVLHTQREGWRFTVLFSGTKRAHDLGRTRDWVVIHAAHDEHAENRHTIVTETRGKLAGRRMIRGREAACRSYYRRMGAPATTTTASRAHRGSCVSP